MNLDQALAAEPGFHRDAPQGGEAGVISIHRLSDHRSEPLEQQPKNFFPLALPAAAKLVVVCPHAKCASRDNMNYMYSISANSGVMRLGVKFDVKT